MRRLTDAQKYGQWHKRFLWRWTLCETAPNRREWVRWESVFARFGPSKTSAHCVWEYRVVEYMAVLALDGKAQGGAA